MQVTGRGGRRSEPVDRPGARQGHDRMASAASKRRPRTAAATADRLSRRPIAIPRGGRRSMTCCRIARGISFPSDVSIWTRAGCSPDERHGVRGAADQSRLSRPEGRIREASQPPRRIKLERLRAGIELRDGPTRPAIVNASARQRSRSRSPKAATVRCGGDGGGVGGEGEKWRASHRRDRDRDAGVRAARELTAEEGRCYIPRHEALRHRPSRSCPPWLLSEQPAATNPQPPRKDCDSRRTAVPRRRARSSPSRENSRSKNSRTPRCRCRWRREHERADARSAKSSRRRWIEFDGAGDIMLTDKIAQRQTLSCSARTAARRRAAARRRWATSPPSAPSPTPP